MNTALTSVLRTQIKNSNVINPLTTRSIRFGGLKHRELLANGQMSLSANESRFFIYDTNTNKILNKTKKNTLAINKRINEREAAEFMGGIDADAIIADTTVAQRRRALTHRSKLVFNLTLDFPRYTQLWSAFSTARREFGAVCRQQGETNYKINVSLLAQYWRIVIIRGVEQRETRIGHLSFASLDEGKIAANRTVLGGRYSEVLEQQLTVLADNALSTNAVGLEGSGWSLEYIVSMTINGAKFNPNRGRSYFPMDNFISRKKAVINVQNSDDCCLLWSILAAIHPVPKDAERCSKYRTYFDELKDSRNWANVPVTDIPEIEHMMNLSINIFLYKYGSEMLPEPLFMSSHTGPKHVNILLVQNGNDSHYVYIKNFNRLVNGGEMFIQCERCLKRFYNDSKMTKEEKLQQHIVKTEGLCHASIQCATLPNPGTVLRFQNSHKALRCPYAIYFDFESCMDQSAARRSGEATEHLAQHRAISYGLRVVSVYPEHNTPLEIYVGADAAEHFVRRVIALRNEIMNRWSLYTEMTMTEHDRHQYATATSCNICGKATPILVRDHDHMTGAYRQALCSPCNLKHNPHMQFIPCFAHNLKGYDSHLIIDAVANMADIDESITFDAIPSNGEKFISFMIGKLRFIDTFGFMAEGLAKLAHGLNSNNLHVTDRHCALNGYSDDQKKMLLMKGIFPYEAITGVESLARTSLYPIADFYSQLTNEHISAEDYAHACTVWETFNMKTMRDYHDLYLATDVNLLADIFENFRTVCMDAYGLDPAQYYTAPGLAFDAALKMSCVELELIDNLNEDMYEMLESGIRGGISVISHRHAKANNPYMGSEYKSDEPTSYISYLDANNLYGWAMSQPLPTGAFNWHQNPSSLTAEDLHAVPDGTDMILEVDLEYPQELHDLHNDYPLAAESVESDASMWSPYTARTAAVCGVEFKVSHKLMPNLRKKVKYVVHRRNLLYYISKGLRLTHVHRAITFNCSPWLKSYIDFNTGRRKLATSDFEKDFFKLMNNSVFGKTMENVRNRCTTKFCFVNGRDDKKILKHAANPGYLSWRNVGANLIAIDMSKNDVKLNKPIYTGFVILELSKLLMYSHHYDVMLPRYGPENLRLLFTDTDSLCYHIKTPDVYRDMLEMRDLFDLSEMPAAFNDSTNKKVIGKFKDETSGCPIIEFVGLRSKMYSIQVYTGQSVVDKKRAKGIKKNVVKRDITHDHYRRCVLEQSDPQTIRQSATMTKIGSRNHQITTQRITKVGLCSIDDKRFICDDGVTTLAHGHYRTL